MENKKSQGNLVDPEYLILLHQYDFKHYENIPKPKYKHPPIVLLF
jgi:hypothetical protein